ncbi:hypothetical protein SLEP1_g44163 [Rubroshorea leprosula]|uniref:Reverse transcriptase domain-containing protein n=1 Tax=Rubroshorea leprosula TaxID=152421 RepID=A0AAV5LFC0_9ROSI|nr:hypothetical protein SLEP1_g44163 [Rubroshorea leprosula]
MQDLEGEAKHRGIEPMGQRNRDRKLWVNAPKYEDDQKEDKGKRTRQAMEPILQTRSYAEALRGPQEERHVVGELRQPMENQLKRQEESRSRARRGECAKDNRTIWQQKGKRKNWVGFEYNTKTEDCGWLDGCYVEATEAEQGKEDHVEVEKEDDDVASNSSEKYGKIWIQILKDVQKSVEIMPDSLIQIQNKIDGVNGVETRWDDRQICKKGLAANLGEGNDNFMGGDFNAVRNAGERAGCREASKEMREFDYFIQDVGLIDLPLVWRKFTWYNSNGEYMSRIDRIDWGPKPFKFFDSWLEKPGCKEMIKKVWNSTTVKGWKGCGLKEKLKRTKQALKEWSGKSMTDVDGRIKETEREIATLDDKGENISESNNELFTKAFTEEEIRNAVWDCDSTKSPRSNGFNFRLIKTMWEEIKQDVVGFIQEFHEQGRLVRGSNASFIALIPKVENPQRIEEYRPISLIGIMYKIIAKLLANRLRKVIDKIIGEQQMAFIRGRQLVDGAVIANEVIEEAKRKKKKCFSFKVDFEKAYNKGLNSLVSSVVEKELYRGMTVGNDKVMVSHLMFTDDTIFFDEASEDNIWVVKCIMRTFELVSGLKINYGESQLMGIGVEDGLQAMLMLDNWKGRHLSLRDRIMLINSVLSSLLVFLMSVYLIPKGKEKDCYQMGTAYNGTWEWNLAWRQKLFQWEEEAVKEIYRMIENVKISPSRPDKWEWVHNKNGQYSTATTYLVLTKEGRGPDEAKFFKRVEFYSLEQNCRLQLESEEEDSNHLFLKCNVVRWVWLACARWWGITITLDKDCLKTFENFGAWSKDSRTTEGWDCIWNTVIWSMWLTRNQIIYRDSKVNRGKLFELIRLRSFAWIKVRKVRCYFNLSNWLLDPISCLTVNCGGNK